MPAAAERFLQAFDEISSHSTGVTASDVAGALGVSIQSARRLLDSMVEAGLCEREPNTRRYFLALAFCHWGYQAAERYSPPPLVQQEMVRFAERTNLPIYYLIRDRNWIVGMQVVKWEVDVGPSAVPFNRRYHWADSLIGLTMVAFLSQEDLDTLAAEDPKSKQALAKLQSQLTEIRKRGFAERDTGESAYLAMAPVLDQAGCSVAVLVTHKIEVPPQEERDRLVSTLQEACKRASTVQTPINVMDDLN